VNRKTVARFRSAGQSIVAPRQWEGGSHFCRVVRGRIQPLQPLGSVILSSRRRATEAWGHSQNSEKPKVEGRATKQSPGHPRPHPRGPAEPSHVAVRGPAASPCPKKNASNPPLEEPSQKKTRKPNVEGRAAKQNPDHPRPHHRGPAEPSRVAIGSPAASPCPQHHLPPIPMSRDRNF